MEYPFIGKKTVFLGSEKFDPELVQDEVGTVTVTPSTTEVASQAGTTNVPNGAYDEMSATVNLIINDIATLGRIFPSIYKKSTYANAKGGQVQFGAGDCKTTSPIPVIIHNACENGSTQDVQIPAGLIQNGGEFTISLGDPFVVEVNITPTATTSGYVIFGEGDLTKATKYDPTTQKYVAVTQS